MGRGNIHIGLKTQKLVVEDITTEDFQVGLPYLTVNMLVDVLLDLGILDISLFLQLGLRRTFLTDHNLLGRVTGMVLAHTVVSCSHGCIGSTGGTTGLQLLVVLLAQTADLVDLNTTLHQLCHYLALAGTSLRLPLNELHHLLVTHSLSANQHRHCHYKN